MRGAWKEERRQRTIFTAIRASLAGASARRLLSGEAPPQDSGAPGRRAAGASSNRSV